jgi:L-cysteine desulfidase
MSQLHHYYLEQLHQQLVPALGCSEPITVALACAHCRDLLGQPLVSLDVKVSANLYKNAAGVTVPGTGQQGLPIAAAAGFVAGVYQAGLEVLAGFTPHNLKQAEELLARGVIDVSYIDTRDVLYTRVIAKSSDHECEVIIEGEHTGVTLIRRDDEVLHRSAVKGRAANDELGMTWSLDSIVRFAQTIELESIEFLRRTVELNYILSEEGLSTDYGLSVGRSLLRQQQAGLLGDDLMTRAMMLSAAASDARMGGAPLAAMSNSGSGNQGIAATLPVIAASQVLHAPEEKLLRALAMSHLIAIYIKRQQDKLSALCAATTAAMGSAGAITWLLGGQADEIDGCIRTMIGDVSGVLCDGAKAGCALKVSTGASSAVKSALMAVYGGPIRCDGIVELSADASISNLGALSREGMQATDRQMIALISDKQRRQLLSSAVKN